MAYGMKYTKGGFPFKASPAKQDDFLKSQNEEAVKSTDYLTKTPVGPVATKKTDDSGTLDYHLEKRGDALGAPTAGQMENKGDFNISNLHTDTKISLDKKKNQ